MVPVDNCDHHQDLLARSRLDQRTATRLPDVGGLGVHHVGERGASLERHRDGLGEARDDRKAGPRGEVVERPGHRSPRAYLGEDPAELDGELTPGPGDHAVERGDRSLPGRDGEREQLGNRWELREHAALALLHLRGQAVLTRQRTDHEGDQAQDQQRQRAARLTKRNQTRDHGSRREGDQAPQRLLDAELVDGQRKVRALEPAAHRCASPEHTVEGAGDRGQRRPEDGRERRGGPVTRHLRARTHGGEVADVGQDTLLERRSSHRRHPVEHEQQPGAGSRAEQGSPHRHGHDRIRSS